MFKANNKDTRATLMPAGIAVGLPVCVVIYLIKGMLRVKYFEESFCCSSRLFEADSYLH